MHTHHQTSHTTPHKAQPHRGHSSTPGIGKRKDKWICLFVSIILGSIVGFFTYKIRKLGTFAIGGWLGYVISLICYSSFMYKI
jgi:hypothetical protein